MRVRILKIMADKGDWAIPELATALKLSTSQVRSAIRSLIDVHKIYHSSRIESPNKNTYRIVSFGESESITKGAGMVCGEDAKYKTQPGQRHCSRVASLPDADQALDAAIFAMIRISRDRSRAN